MLKKAYVEITNVCNLACSFCPGTRRAPGYMSCDRFRILAEKLHGHTRFLYFHLMGEPLLHPELSELLQIADEFGFRVCITTNGSLLPRSGAVLVSSPATHRVNISLQSYEGNGSAGSLREYMDGVANFARLASPRGIICSLRLWNGGGENSENSQILALLHEAFPDTWTQCPRNLRLADHVFLEHGDKFDWPSLSSPESDVRFCYGLRDQIGILCDGTVVPCCLDSEGSIPLGNLFDHELDAILASPRARSIYDGFSSHQAREELCRRCGYASRFKKY